MSPSTLLAHPINQWHIAFPIWKTIHQARMWLNSAKIHNYYEVAAAAAKSLQSCPTLCDPVDCSPPGSPVPGILQARTLEWVAISLSNAWKWKVKVKSLSRFQLLATPWTAAYQAPPSTGFSRQEYWSRVTSPSLTHFLTCVQIRKHKPMQRTTVCCSWRHQQRLRWTWMKFSWQ